MRLDGYNSEILLHAAIKGGRTIIEQFENRGLAKLVNFPYPNGMAEFSCTSKHLELLAGGSPAPLRPIVLQGSTPKGAQDSVLGSST